VCCSVPAGLFVICASATKLRNPDCGGVAALPCVFWQTGSRIATSGSGSCTHWGMLAGTPWYPLCPWPCHSIAVCVCWSGALQESLAEQLEEGYRQSIWLPQRGRLQAQAEGGFAARLELTTHVEKGLYALFASGDGRFACRGEEAWLEALLQAAAWVLKQHVGWHGQAVAAGAGQAGCWMLPAVCYCSLLSLRLCTHQVPLCVLSVQRARCTSARRPAGAG
jgi:hypothetical protein